MDTVGIRAPTMQIREFSTFSMSSALRHGPSVRCAIAANDIQISEYFLGKHIVSFEDNSCTCETV
jgi:hypothetical protein